MARKNNTYIRILFIFTAITIVSCEKIDEAGFMDVPYHEVADVKEYCQGACESAYDWENKKIGVKGYIPGITDTEVMNDYKSSARFYLEDIRNGMFISIKVENNLNDIFDSLMLLQKNDRLFIKGIARPVTANDGTKCEKGMFMEISQLENIEVNIK
jgi:hypothetical protein